VVSVAHRHGLDVPRDLSVVGFDDTVGSHDRVARVDDVRQPVAAMADSAVDILLRSIRHKERDTRSRRRPSRRASIDQARLVCAAGGRARQVDNLTGTLFELPCEVQPDRARSSFHLFHSLPRVSCTKRSTKKTEMAAAPCRCRTHRPGPIPASRIGNETVMREVRRPLRGAGNGKARDRESGSETSRRA
jgi:hypothetical protein